MKAVIFAGGVGTRLWPLSRKRSPKQFEKVVGDKSTLQLAAEKLEPEFKPEDIFISTGTDYVEIVKDQLPFLPPENIIAEPCKRDVGPAVALVLGYLAKRFPHEPVIILWSDHLVKRVNEFKKIIVEASNLVEENKECMVFIGQKPRFASENLGWIETGKELRNRHDISFRSFEGFKYRPKREVAEEYANDPKYCWNLGYFVSTPTFIYSMFKHYAPNIYEVMERILEAHDPTQFQDLVNKNYQDMPEIISVTIDQMRCNRHSALHYL